MTWLLVSILTALLAPAPADDASAARALFQRNLDAIRRQDKAAYLSCYLDSPKLAKTGADGITLGFPAFAKAAGENWPDTFDASDLQLEAPQPIGVGGERRRQNLDGHVPLQPRVLRAIHLAHAARAER